MIPALFNILLEVGLCGAHDFESLFFFHLFLIVGG